jgi:hypothetical protein
LKKYRDLQTFAKKIRKAIDKKEKTKEDTYNQTKVKFYLKSSLN